MEVPITTSTSTARERRRRAPFAAFVAAMLWAGWASAGMIDESGLQPWENCALCHSLDGISRMAKFPKLAGQVPAYIMKQIKDFRGQKRTNDAEQMQAMAGLIRDADIPRVAAYFGGLTPPAPAPAPDAAAKRLAEPLFRTGDAKRGLPACLSCHGLGALATSGAPRIEAQHAGYVAKQLRDFKSGERGNDPAKVMQGVAAKLTDAEIAALGGYVAAQPRVMH